MERTIKNVNHSAQRHSLSSSGGRRMAVAFILLTMAELWVQSAYAQPAAVPTMVVQGQSVASNYELDGVIQPIKLSVLAAQTTGRVASVAVRAGDKVQAGQVLATIDDREAIATVQHSQALAAQADAELRNANTQWQRTRDLQQQGFVSHAALDSAQAQLRTASAARDAATAATLQSSIAQGFTRVRAPYDGWVQQIHAEAGDLAVPVKPLVTVFAPQPLRATVQVPASRTSIVRDATQTWVQVPSAQGAAWVEPVARSTVPATDPVAQTAEWRFELAPQQNFGLQPGQQVRVRFGQAQDKATPSRLLLPATALLRRGELTAVYTVANGGFSLRAVRAGAERSDATVEILAGLQSGETVAVDAVRAGLAGALPAKVPSAKQ